MMPQSLGEDYCETTTIPESISTSPGEESEGRNKMQEDTSAPPSKVSGRMCLPKRVSEGGGHPTGDSIWEIVPPQELANFALRDYFEKHGVRLVFVRLMDFRKFHGPGYLLDFSYPYATWVHLNFEAKRPGSSDKLLLFAELYTRKSVDYLTTLSLVQPTNGACGCQVCLSNISHPRHGCRAGFDPPVVRVVPDGKALRTKAGDTLAELALSLYNNKHETDLKFVRGLASNSFTCPGRLMDFNTKNTSWVHLNFEATGPEGALHLFAELYLGDDNVYVLATLSMAEPSDRYRYISSVDWTNELNIEPVCPCCPDEIRHPWRGYRFDFNSPPSPDSDCSDGSDSSDLD